MTNYNRPSKYKKYLTLNENDGTPPSISRQTRWFRNQENNTSSSSSSAYENVNNGVTHIFNENVNLTVEDDLARDEYDIIEAPVEINTAMNISNSENNSDFEEEFSENIQQEFINNERNSGNLNSSIITSEESELLLLAFALRHKLTSRALDDLIELINCHTHYPIHQSKYCILKKFNDTITPPKVHYFCNKCQAILNEQNELTSETVLLCSRCTHENVVEKLKEESCYFLSLPLGIQIKHLLESDLSKKLNWYSGISDVRTGTFYQKIRDKNINNKYLTIQWNTDGIQVFNSSKISVWPLQVMLNELPYHEQRENIILTGLWFSPIKPDMNTFLLPFVQELCYLHDYGIDVQLPGVSGLTNFKIYTIISSVDSVARPMIQKIKQFNGKFGCSYCLNEGTVREVGRGHSRVYLGNVGPKRTLSQHIADCNYVDQNIDISDRNGVKGASVVLLLDTFHIIDSFVPDYMHCVLLGVVKTFVNIWFDSTFSDKECYIGSCIEEFDSRLLNIKPPTEITRTPRSINDRKQWKASEWRTFLIYYSSVCLKGLLPESYYQHWTLLVLAIYNLLVENCTDEQINNSENYLMRFVFSIPSLYGENFMKFNVHILLHLASHVKRWGALWAWSAFPYEHYNGVIGKFFHGTQFIPKQIIRTYQLTMTINGMISKIQTINSTNGSTVNPRILNLLKKLNGYNYVTKATCLDSTLITFGTPEIIQSLNVRQKLCIENKIGIQLTDNSDLGINSYKRFIVKGILVHTTTYERLKKRDNSTLYLNSGVFVDTTHLFSIPVKDSFGNTIWKCVLLGKQLIPIHQTNSIYLGHSSTITAEESDNIICFIPEEILKKCVRIFQNNNTYVTCTPIVNSLERD